MDDRALRATIGLSASKFNQLALSFGPEIEKERWFRYEIDFEQGNRKRKPGGGRKGNFENPAEKLFFILFYFKCYPTFDVMGLFFNIDRSNACRNVQKLTLLLEKVLGKKMALPKRKINSLKELFELFPGAKDIFIDWTESQIQRSSDNEKQKESYSGKKKARTRKNIERLFPPKIFPKDITLWLDLGFTGVNKDYPDASVMMPKKKPRGKELSDEEKARNNVISSIRVRVEHAIGGIKRMRITTDKFRNKKESFFDKPMLISCGLWNYHLLCR